jgi:hypothetical protein
MEVNKIMPKKRGVYAAIAKKFGVSRQNVRKSILSGSDKYAMAFAELCEQRVKLIDKVNDLLMKEIA